MATATVATAAAMAVVLYFLLSRRIAATRTDGEEDHGGGGSVHKVERVAAGRRRIARRPAQPPATWREAVATLVETLRFTYSETLGKWPIGDLAFGIKYLMRRQVQLNTIANPHAKVKHFILSSVIKVMASSWLNDLRDQIQRTRILNVIYRSASALGSHLPSISSARAKVAGAGALLQPVSSKTQDYGCLESMASQYPVLNNRPIDQWKVTELKEELRRRKIPVRGLKEELVRKLFEAIRTEEMIKEQETGDQVQSDCPDPTLDGDGDQKQAENSAADHTNIVPDPIGQSHSDASAIDINCSDTIPDPVGKTDCDATITDIDINREIKVQNATTATSALDVTVLETQANTVLLEDSATESQTVITQCESRVMVSRTEEKHEEEKQEDSNVPDEDIKPSLSDLDNQVSVVSPDLGFQVKCESIPIDSVSIVEKNKLKDNLNADDFHLEQELVKPEMVQPSSSSVPSVGGDLQSLGDDKDLQSLDDDKDLKSSGDDKEQAKHLVSLEDTYVKSSTNFNLSKEDNIDEGSPEKLNLDRCSSDELMEEDVLEGKQIDPNMKSEDVAEKSEVKQEPAVGARTNIKDGLLESIPDKKDTVDEDHRKQEGSTEREN
ncbi:Lipase 3 N-terminal region [Musa troglodytarum]|uniref:Lipase 3 N-terminal region n=1 Tax=Musa troglodytarum TaxID=320322 RepID=A0A9E7IBU7_9LILI|nr:Lipase 3 N-terminal region [Musa troglodytarum]